MNLAQVLGHKPNIYVRKETGPDLDGGIMFQTAIPLNVETVRVQCPHCEKGYTDVPIDRVGDQIKLRNIKQPYKCIECDRWFRIEVQLKLVGKAFE